jgi:3-dehydroquinate synthase
VVGRDEKEAGERRVLNFGHTLGHAFEARLGLSHGEAVSLGMVAAADISVRRGLLPAGDAGRLRALLGTIGLPTSLSFDRDAILDAVRKDKKRAGTGLKFVFLKGIGQPVVEDIPLGELEGHIHDLR